MPEIIGIGPMIGLPIILALTRCLHALQDGELPIRDSAQTHTETGPTLAEVLRAARVRTGLSSWVAAVGSDGYVADVTPAEAWPGGRPLLISLLTGPVPPRGSGRRTAPLRSCS